MQSFGLHILFLSQLIMKKIFLILTGVPFLYFSQKKEVLRYFKSEDSLVGVKNENGKIIVPAQFKIYSDLEDGEVVKGETIYFDGLKKNEQKEKNAWGFVYDKKGNFLYRPFFYDNSADYFSEGVRRFVKNGKVGFVDRNGKVIIDARHDFASPFNFGYAKFCDGCDWEKTENEHKAIVGGTWGMMNFKGEIVKPVSKSENTIEIDGNYYPYPFKYNEKEKSILQFFEKQNRKLSEIYYVNYASELAENQKKLFFEIVERPKENFPFYKVNTYNYGKREAGIFDFKFQVSENGKNVFAIEYEDEKLSFDKWLKKAMKDAVEYQKSHTDNLNKLSK